MSIKRSLSYQALGMIHCQSGEPAKYSNPEYLSGYALQYEIEQIQGALYV